MELKIKDIVELLNVSEKTVYRWIKEKKIPCYRINYQYRFNKAEINEWILSNKIELSSATLQLSTIDETHLVSGLVEKGGVVRDIAGITVPQVLEDAVQKIPLSSAMRRDEILTALLHREELMPTAIGKGLAVPHPRNPITTDHRNAQISICYLTNAVDFGALDKELVHTLFILLTSTPKMHLEVLSKISYLCQDEKFYALLKERASQQNIVSYIRDREKEWKRGK